MKENIKSDVVIIGAGTGGIFTALYLTLKNHKVILIEKTSKIGGALTINLVYPTAGFHTPNLTEISSPLVKQFLKESIENKLSLGHIKDPLNFASTITPIHPTAYNLLLLKLLKHKNLLFLKNSNILSIKTQNDKIKSITVSSNDKIYEINAHFWVDASGILITSNFIPIKYTQNIQNLQALTLIFKISNVNTQQIIKDVMKNPQEFYHKTDPDLMIKQNFISISGYYSLAKEKLNNPNLLLTRDRFLFFSDIQKDTVVVNTTRLFIKDIINPTHPPNIEEIQKKAYPILLQQTLYIHKTLKQNIPAFKDSYISEIAQDIGIRQYKNIIGHYTLTLQDIKEGKMFEDNVSIGTWPIDIHLSKGLIEDKINENGYGIPLRCCLNEYKNIVFIGKNISADEYAFSSARIQATIMIMGENIGRILHHCLKTKSYPHNLNTKQLKKITQITIKQRGF